MKKALLLIPSAFLLLAGMALSGVHAPVEVDADCQYSGKSLPTEIDLNDTTDNAIKTYYKGVNGLSGNGLLAKLKTILSNGQKYFSYDSPSGSDNAIWKVYEITDRDWSLSPADQITSGTYNPSTNKITNYSYHSSDNPYLHVLYRNRGDATGYITAWGDHSGTTGFNREHVWPKCRGFDDDSTGVYGARGDLHHLMAGDGWVNTSKTQHNNNPYAFVDKSKTYTDGGSKFTYDTGNYSGTALNVSSNQTVFEPQDCDKGDIARACFYMVARYNNVAGTDSNIDSANPNLTLSDTTNTATETSTSSHAVSLGVLRDLLAWHKLDPVDEYEIHRNNIIYNSFTENRNPFIDYPQWVDYIWGSVTMAGDGRTITSYSSSPTGTVSLVDDVINGYRDSGETPSTISYLTVTNAKTVYEINDSFVTPAVTAHWSTGEETDVTAECTFTGFSSAAAGVCQITVSHTSGKSTTYSITVNPDASGLATDVLNKAFTGVSSGYTDWSGKSDPSGSEAVYAGNSSAGNDTIQIRTTNSNSGIVTTASGGNIRKVQVTWHEATTAPRTLQVYGKNTPYESASDLYDEDKQGELIKTFLYDGSEATLSSLIDGDYAYVGIRSLNYAQYISEIRLSYEEPTPVTLTVTDTLNNATTGISGTQYNDWSAEVESSSALYVGNSAGGNSSIQLRTDKSNAGIVATSSGGKIKSIQITWNSNTTTGRSLDIYGKSTAYSATTDLHSANAATQGVLIATFTKVANETETEEIVIAEAKQYPFIGIRSRSGALYVEEILITYESAEVAAENYSADFLSTYTKGCDPTGVSSNVNWNGAKASAAILSKAAQTILREANHSHAGSVGPAMARYDYIVITHGTDAYEDFLSRDPGAGAKTVLALNNSKASWIVPLLVLAGVGAGIILLVYRKRKHEA